ncbi:hypothetical protein MyNCGM152_51660 [Achromobacter xylosoxidans]
MSTALRILKDLEAEGFVERDPVSKHYMLGPQVYAMHHAMVDGLDLRALARPALIRLARKFGDTVILSMPTGWESVCLDLCFGDYPIRANYLEIGSRRPLGIGAGSLALLAAMDENETQAVLPPVHQRLQERYPRYPVRLLEQMTARARKLGHAMLLDVVVEKMGGLGDAEYEAWLAAQPADAPWEGPRDEWDNLCLNYTSGTTGNPKGVLYHHRGAYLNATGNVLACGMPPHAVYLWTLPMFHCNGWCFPWTMAALAGTNVCLRRVEPAAIFEAIRRHRVGFFCAAPVVLNMLVNAPADARHRATHRVQAMTGGAAPPAAIIEAMEQLGVGVTHLYGLTETYGPSISCAWHEEWDDLPLAERAALKARIGVRKLNVEAVRVMDAAMRPVPADGATLGEIMLRGNTLMKGYLHNPEATADAFADGWFHSGDLAVVHPDGYIEIKDRAKDIIISGGENISTVEIESVLYRHPDVLEAAVVARPDAVWGETPCAFVTLKDGAACGADDLIAYCREHLARFKTPRTVVFGALPKTSTGKIQKFVLREQAAALADKAADN